MRVFSWALRSMFGGQFRSPVTTNFQYRRNPILRSYPTDLPGTDVISRVDERVQSSRHANKAPTRVLFAFATAVTLILVPSASLAQQPPKAAIGIAMMPFKTTSRAASSAVKVMEVRPGGTGDQMGILVGDLITHAGGKRVTSDQKLIAYIMSLEVGGPVELTVSRRGKTLQLSGKAMARPW